MPVMLFQVRFHPLFWSVVLEMTVLFANRSACSFPYVYPRCDRPVHPLILANPRLRNAADGSDFMGERMTVQFARGTRQRENAYGERAAPRPRRTSHRMQISGLPPETSWQVCLLSPSPPFCFSFQRRTTYFPGPVSSPPPVPIPVPWSCRCALLCE
jgi:hypothetical protein